MIITTHEQIKLPKMKCPKCNGRIVLEDIDAWTQDVNGRWLAENVSLGCTNGKDFDDRDYHEWFDWHYGTPYIDWLPVTEQIKDWINEHYQWSFFDDKTD